LSGLRQTANDLKLKGEILPRALDLSHSSDLKSIVSAHFDRVDVLINNAGRLLNKPFSEISEQDLQDTYQVNVFTPFKIVQQLVPIFNKSAHIINIGSVGGVNGTQKFPGLSAYSSSKAALSCLTECLQVEFHDSDLTFNCLALGAVQTEMLSQAFPDYKAEIGPESMANYIFEFALNAPTVLRGHTHIVSRSNP
jgi:NAD(P)-dependent dehydrogenase (short-subunit alcohol dehydrogenase family)